LGREGLASIALALIKSDLGHGVASSNEGAGNEYGFKIFIHLVSPVLWLWFIVPAPRRKAVGADAISAKAICLFRLARQFVHPGGRYMLVAQAVSGSRP
jgi:hypothetical protein